MLYEKQYASSNGEREVECIICETTTCMIFVLGFSLGNITNCVMTVFLSLRKSGKDNSHLFSRVSGGLESRMRQTTEGHDCISHYS